MRGKVFLAFFCLLSIMSAVFARELTWEWGPKGYDHKGAGKRFSLEGHYNDNALIDIWVDAVETVDKARTMTLVSSDGREVVSQKCVKAERHITAPRACAFFKEDLRPLAGSGTLVVLDDSAKTILQGAIDFDHVNRALKAMEQQ